MTRVTRHRDPSSSVHGIVTRDCCKEYNGQMWNRDSK